jgi:DNA-binding transcriptional LysR family regulator
MDFAALQVFKTVAEAGGISAAAKRLHRVQSNVTTRIQSLEASLGRQLFIREKGRLHLSPAGRLFLAYVDQLLELAQRARSALSSDVPSGLLKVGTLESTAASRLPPLLARYHRRYPEVRIELTTGTTDALVDAVLGRRIEAAFVAECKARPQLEILPAFTEELVLIAPRSHAQVRRPQDVSADTIIGFPTGCTYRRLLQEWLASGNVSPERVLELGSYHAIVACVASGTGVAFAPRSVLATLPGTHDVAAYPLGPRKGKAVTSLIWRQGEASPALNAMQLEILSAGKQRLPLHRS